MKTEIEAKWLDINPAVFRSKLKSTGAKLIQPEVLMRRKNFDYPDKRLEKKGGWIRLRDEGDKITLSYKELQDRSLHGTKEVEITVDSFDRTADLFLAIGFVQRGYQETKRETWRSNNVVITIDTWPWIPSFVELEAEDEQTLRLATQGLDLDFSQALHGSVETAYQKYYDVTDADIYSWKRVTFEPVPQWLAKRRR